MNTYHVQDPDADIPVDLTRRVPKPKVHVEQVVLHPELSIKEAENKWLNNHLDGSCVKFRPEVSTFFSTPDGQAKLLFLRDVLDQDVYAKSHNTVRQIKYTPAANSRRKALRGSPGGDVLFGYNDQLQVVGRKRQTYPQLTAPSVHQYQQYRALWPLCWEMEDVFRQYSPEYWQGREIGDERGPGPRGDLEETEFFQYPKDNTRLVRAWSDWGLFYNIPGSNFSTLTANWNTIFRAHKDANNSSGALSCLVAFGRHAGGELCFPRLGVAIDARERDLLVCDCPRELHGTLPLRGTRYSAVAYTREGLTTGGRKHSGLWSY